VVMRSPCAGAASLSFSFSFSLFLSLSFSPSLCRRLMRRRHFFFSGLYARAEPVPLRFQPPTPGPMPGDAEGTSPPRSPVQTEKRSISFSGIADGPSPSKRSISFSFDTDG
jgi:hypothetical protein